jgi:hypothetical protein
LSTAGRHAAGVHPRVNIKSAGWVNIGLARTLERPFEQQERLAGLLVRQRHLQKQLDLDKDSAGASRLDADDNRHAA